MFGVSAGLMGVISGGVEAGVALHIAGNVLIFTVGALLAGGGALSADRSVGSGGVFLLVPAAAYVGMVVLVRVRERRATGTARCRPIRGAGGSAAAGGR